MSDFKYDFSRNAKGQPAKKAISSPMAKEKKMAIAGVSIAVIALFLIGSSISGHFTTVDTMKDELDSKTRDLNICTADNTLCKENLDSTEQSLRSCEDGKTTLSSTLSAKEKSLSDSQSRVSVLESEVKDAGSRLDTCETDMNSYKTQTTKCLSDLHEKNELYDKCKEELTAKIEGYDSLAANFVAYKCCTIGRSLNIDYKSYYIENNNIICSTEYAGDDRKELNC